MYDAVEVHSCIDTNGEISLVELIVANQLLTKILIRVKCPAIKFLSTVVYCSTSEVLVQVQIV